MALHSGSGLAEQLWSLGSGLAAVTQSSPGSRGDPLPCSYKPRSSLPPSTSYLICDSYKSRDLQCLPHVASFSPHCHVCSQSTFPPCAHAPVFCSFIIFPNMTDPASPVHPLKDSELKLFLCWKVIMAARHQLVGLLWTAKQLEAEAELIMKQGLQNLWRFWPEVPSLFPQTNGHILWMLAGDTWAGKSPSCRQLYNPGYGVLHVMPSHLTNTHDCCCQAALDKENVLMHCSGSWGNLNVGFKG